jgi:hypothetical protein
MNQQPRVSGDATRTLPPRPHLDHLRNEAKARLKQMRQSDPGAKLAAAQLAVARDYGFSSWRSLRAHLAENTAPPAPENEIARRLHDQSRPRQETSINPAFLADYAGHYRLSSSAIVTVTQQDGQLFARLTGQAAYPLYPESATKFFYKVVPAQITFTRGEDHRVTMLTLHQNGYDRPAPRIADEMAEDFRQQLAQRLRAGTAMAGSEPALRRQIEAMIRNHGEPDYAEMTPELAEISRPQLPALAAQIDELGALRTLAFVGVGRRGWDIYQAEFEHGAAIFRILLNMDGKIEGLLFQQGP